MKSDELPHPGRLYDLILMQQVIWYILPHLAQVFAKIHTRLAADGVLFIEQCFPDVQNFGREYLDSGDMLISKYLIPAGFKVEKHFRQMLEEGMRGSPEADEIACGLFPAAACSPPRAPLSGLSYAPSQFRP